MVKGRNKERLKLWIGLLRTTRGLETVVRNRLREEFGVTLPRFDVMAALFRKPDGMMMSELSRYLMVSNGNVTGMVDRLVNDGLAVRSQRDGDRRTWIISLSKAGQKNFAEMAKAHEGWINELFDGFDRGEAVKLQKTLLRLRNDQEEDQ